MFLWNSRTPATTRISQSQSHITTDGRSVSMSWCPAHSGTCDQIFFPNLLSCLCGAPSLTRGRVSLLSVQSIVVSQYLHSPCWTQFSDVQYIQGLVQSRLCTAEYALVTSSLLYYGSLDSWTVVHMTAATFKPLIFSMSGLALANVANIFISMVLDDFCLLPAWIRLCHLQLLAHNITSPLDSYWIYFQYTSGFNMPVVNAGIFT
jgi:hypothetical protein